MNSMLTYNKFATINDTAGFKARVVCFNFFFLPFLCVHSLILTVCRLAEARSNPNLLDIGDHMARTPAGGEVHQYMRGETSPSDYTKVKSHDDLLLL